MTQEKYSDIIHSEVLKMNYENTTKIFSERLRALRTEAKLTQKQCAAQLGVELYNYNKWENEVNPPLGMICKMAEHFSVTTDYLLGLEDSRTHDGQAVFEKLGLNDKAIEVLSVNDSMEFEETVNINERLNNLFESDVHEFYANFVNVLTSHDTKDFVLAFQVLTSAIEEAQSDRSSAAVRRKVFPDASDDELDIMDDMRYDERIGYFAYQSNKHFMKFLDDLQRESYHISKGENNA